MNRIDAICNLIARIEKIEIQITLMKNELDFLKSKYGKHLKQKPRQQK